MMVDIKKTKTMIAVLVDIAPSESKAARFLRLQGLTGSLKYSDRLEFMVMNDNGQIEDGFRTSEFTEEPKKDGRIITFTTQNSIYKFRELF